MKILISSILVVLIVQLSSADEFINGYAAQTELLDVPDDPSTWKFKGNSKPADRGGRISNGNQATDTQFPFTAELSINAPNRGFLCTASIISNLWLIGARHCVANNNARSIRALMGSADRLAARTSIFSYSFSYLNSPTGTDHPDIALFLLSQPVTFSSTIQPVRLPAASQVGLTYEGQIMTAAGWGGIGNGRYSRYLQWTKFVVLPLRICNFGIYLCSQPPTGISSLEGGDSGGPSVIYENGVPTLVGINVFVATRGTIVRQGSTKVNLFLKFINLKTGIPIRP